MIRQGTAQRRRPRQGASRTTSRRSTRASLKVMSKMGISTIQSYRGAQIFEAIGLNKDVVDQYFTWTASRIGGVGLDVIAEEVALAARPRVPRPAGQRPRRSTSGGQYQWRARGEYHLFNPETVHKLQHACPHRQLQGVQGIHRRWSTTKSQRLCTLRGLLEFKLADQPIPHRGSRAGRGDREALQDRAPCRYGSISKEAHETLAIAMNRIGGKSNTGEGGEDPARYMPDANGDSQEQRHQAGGLGPLRRHQRLPGQRRRAADQDGPGRQARRRRPAARPQGLPLDRQGPPLDAGRGPDLAAAAPRHLLDRGPGAS